MSFFKKTGLTASIFISCVLLTSPAFAESEPSEALGEKATTSFEENAADFPKTPDSAFAGYEDDWVEYFDRYFFTKYYPDRPLASATFGESLAPGSLHCKFAAISLKQRGDSINEKSPTRGLSHGSTRLAWLQANLDSVAESCEPVRFQAQRLVELRTEYNAGPAAYYKRRGLVTPEERAATLAELRAGVQRTLDALENGTYVEHGWMPK